MEHLGYTKARINLRTKFRPEKGPERIVRDADPHNEKRPEKPPAVAFGVTGLLIAVVATAYNLVVVFVLFSQGLLPLLSLLAVAYGGYLVISQWSLFRSAQLSH